ncbi:hypothetical protein SK803_08175 [Lentzea sp. BCCO 10_0856]|uniref:Uncharacterized protein n=1 Tax=Lentzea miocenica TaxID=3095431 RepID=A0ABU4SW94_9PSEU|nr:hypothetical protein [Lentzea sp. BCCO 10_0856]MDX8030184.1 hypothetical protein [Lentzea sp. BCCO 10_0856]
MPREIEFVVVDPDGDALAASEASDLLLEELDRLDFDRLDRATTTTEEQGTRSGAVMVVGTLVGLVTSPVVVRSAVEVVKSWLVRRERGSVTITCGEDALELTAVSNAQQEALVKAFLDRHATD